ncbi:MAG: radical SAM protein [Methylococcaceae bacterium]
MARQIQIKDPITGELFEAIFDHSRFSAFRCFSMQESVAEIEVPLLRRLSQEVVATSERLALYRSGPFLDYLLDHVPELVNAVTAVIDQNASTDTYRGLPVVVNISSLPPDTKAILLCETRMEICWRLRRQMPQNLACFSPDMASRYFDLVPEHAWIPNVQSIYPFNTPEIQIRPDLDVLLLDLPSRAGWQMPVGTGYVHNALKRSTVNHQTLDTDMIVYHRYQIHRLFDLGHEPILRNGLRMSQDPWDYNERMWLEPKYWPFLVDYFAEFIDEVVAKLKKARPKILGMSVHQRNEWITREMARRVKCEIPEMIILVGGHSCFTPTFGPSAFPEHDYMVIGEADLVIGPLVEKLARGEHPHNVPGVISRYDTPDHKFVPSPQAHDIDALGGFPFEIYGDMNAIYRTWYGFSSTALSLTRGCVWSRCTFCAERFAFRSRTAKHYVDDIERVIATGRPGNFSASDSDFGGSPERLHEIFEEIVKRNLKINFSGQIRINKKYNVDFFKLMHAAGVNSLNFGSDGFTANTIRLQRKGYTIKTLLENHRDCVAAGIVPNINIVIGVPGETDTDITETIKLFSENRDYFPMVNNINMLSLVNNSVYWEAPEKFNIYFYGDKDALYRKYYWGIPSRLWYSTDPFIDDSVRCGRMAQLVTGLQEAGVALGQEVIANYKDMMAGKGYSNIREDLVNDCLALDSFRSSFRMPEQPQYQPVYGNHLIVDSGDGSTIAFNYDEKMHMALNHTGLRYWWKGKLQPGQVLGPFPG